MWGGSGPCEGHPKRLSRVHVHSKQDLEFDYLNILPEKAWKDLENAYTCHLNTVEQTEATTRKRFQNGFIDIYSQMCENLAERKVQVDCHGVAYLLMWRKLENISCHGQKLQQMIIVKIPFIFWG
ncbi:12357_t:CDS:2, partial [Dentiscutata erythropus]